MELSPLSINTLILRSKLIISRTSYLLAKPFYILISNTLIHPLMYQVNSQLAHVGFKSTMFIKYHGPSQPVTGPVGLDGPGKQAVNALQLPLGSF